MTNWLSNLFGGDDKVAPSVTGPHGPATFSLSDFSEYWVGSKDHKEADEKAVAAVQKAKDAGVTDKKELRELRNPVPHSAIARKALGIKKKIQASASQADTPVDKPVDKREKKDKKYVGVLQQALDAGRVEEEEEKAKGGKVKKKKKSKKGYSKKYANGGTIRKPRRA